MKELASIAVYCGSSNGVDPSYVRCAHDFGALLAREGIALVYGGGNVGLMGAVADGALRAGGEVHGVITEALRVKELAHLELTSLVVVDTMHERKAAMADRADAFVALPGGFGTFDELFEVITWTQLGIHEKPCGMLNHKGFFDDLVAFIDKTTAAGFIKPVHRDTVVVEPDGAGMLQKLRVWEPARTPKIVDRGQR
ncbi:MAG: TIGR00730 family Rossman fold protein [Actinobacteria bacterium]|nr:TIGR00730 family Rossman fold protein [Actinomycetota bacterium]NBP54074.1 TIGR00730 family Rossman fold protein [Actinomycetota bacterium]